MVRSALVLPDRRVATLEVLRGASRLVIQDPANGSINQITLGTTIGDVLVPLY